LTVLSGSVTVNGTPVAADQFIYFDTGRDELHFESPVDSRLLLLGGEPFESEIMMWWNFVARSRAELEEAYREWEAGSERFAPVNSTLDRIPAPRPFWLT